MSATDNSNMRIVVCGGGVIGVATAYFLTQKYCCRHTDSLDHDDDDDSTTATATNSNNNNNNNTESFSISPPIVIERHEIACGASGKAGGFLALDWCDSSDLGPLARASFQLHATLAQSLNGYDQYGYRRLDTLSIGMKETASKSTHRFDASKMPRWLDGKYSDVAVLGNKESTAQVHPELFTKAMFEAAKDRGAKLEIGTVIGLEMQRIANQQDEDEQDPYVLTGVKVVSAGAENAENATKTTTIPADAVVIALGPWSGQLASWLPEDIRLPELGDISGLKAHSILLEPQDKSAVSPHALFLSYRTAREGEHLEPEVYPRPDGDVYVCGMTEEPELPLDPSTIRPREESCHKLHEIAKQVSSELANANLKRMQACFLPIPPDGKPLIGRVPGVRGLYVATGHSCWGILNSPATGAAMAELVVEGAAKTVDLSPFDPHRFVKKQKESKKKKKKHNDATATATTTTTDGKKKKCSS